MSDNSVIRMEARKSLKGRWSIAMVVVFLNMLISSLWSIPGLGVVLSVLVGIPLSYSVTIIFLRLARSESVEIGNMVDGFKEYGRVLTTQLMATIYTFLWALLFVIPGIVKGYSYAMTPYILFDTDLQNDEAIERSMAMMRGHKMRLFLMDLGFVMLSILSIFTLGILLLWVVPYWQAARAQFYMDLKGQEVIAE